MMMAMMEFFMCIVFEPRGHSQALHSMDLKSLK